MCSSLKVNCLKLPSVSFCKPTFLHWIPPMSCHQLYITLRGKKKSESEISRVKKILLISYYFKVVFKAILQVLICNIKTKPKLWAIFLSWIHSGLGIIYICVLYILILFHIFMYLLVKAPEQINWKKPLWNYLNIWSDHRDLKAYTA